MQVSFIIKGGSKNKKLFNSIIDKIKPLKLFNNYFVNFTEYPGHAISLGKDYANRGVDLIIAMGGDGTLNEVLNGIMNASNNNSVLGHYPIGTANDFSKTMGLDKNLEQFLGILKNNNTITLDVGKVKCQNNGILNERYFLNIADAGLGGFVANKLNNSKKILGGKIAYFKIIITGILLFKKPHVKIDINNISYTGKLMSLAICNGRTFGNGLIISPDAKVNDGMFNITLLGDVTILDYFRNLKNLKKGIKLNHPNIHYYTSEKIILSSNEKCEIEADGEYVGLGETTFEIIPKSLNFLTPKVN